MIIDDKLLSSNEKLSFELRKLYDEHGYSRFKMSKFEEYQLYAKNKDFLVSDNIITFTEKNGKLMALKPDITLSIVKSLKDKSNDINKVYYNESVFRVSKRTGMYKEITQVGIECIGKVSPKNVEEVVEIAYKTLKTVSDDIILDISHLGILEKILGFLTDDKEIQKELLKFIGEKNVNEGIKLLDSDKAEIFGRLVGIYGSFESQKDNVKSLCKACGALDEFEELCDICENNDYNVDFSIVSDMKYYNGIIFKGFVANVPEAVLSGGSYDRLISKMGADGGAIGFALYLDLLERMGEV